MEELTVEERQKRMDKVSKLLALAMSPNKHESKLAARMAAEMMERYGLSAGDIKTKEDVVKGMTDVRMDGATQSRRKWESALYGFIGKAFECSGIFSVRQPWYVHFVGNKADIEMVLYFAKFLRRWVAKSGQKEYPSDHNKRRDYCFGMVKRLGERLKEFTAKREEIRTPETRALVVVKAHSVESFKKKLFPDTVKDGRNFYRNHDAYMNGYKTGEKIPLARPIDHKGRKDKQVRG